MLKHFFCHMLFICLSSLWFTIMYSIYIRSKYSEQDINSTLFYFFIFFLSFINWSWPFSSRIHILFLSQSLLLPRGESRRTNDKSSPREYLTRGNFASVSICACEIRSCVITWHVTRNEWLLIWVMAGSHDMSQGRFKAILIHFVNPSSSFIMKKKKIW